jgi:hypothetical protein
MDNASPMPNTGYIPTNEPMPASAALEAAQAPVSYPNIHIALHEGLPVLMQSKQPACVGHGVAWALMQKELVRDGSFKLLSARFLYALCKKYDGIPGEGTSIATALWVAENIGVCEDQYFPNDVSLDPHAYIDLSLIPPEAYENAKLHKSKTHKWVTDLSFNGLRNAIFQNDVVIIGMDISDAWWTAPDGRVSWAAPDILPLRPPRPMTSRHCVDLYCYNTEEKLDGLWNSWSEAWGNKGTAFFYGNELPYIYQAAVIFI